ncbi:MAG: hypothetical protein IKV21_02695 [Clostridia bacterium]|nr:hypothetical protein [Clostridia bacterium]
MNISKKITALLLAAVMLMSFSACGKASPDSYTVKKSDGALSVSADTDKKELYVSADKKKMKAVAKSDMTELYFDKNTCTVSVYDTASGKLWSSLPKDNRGEKTAAVSVTVLVDGNSYTLSSQSDSVGFSSALYEEKENGITVNYGFKRTLEDGTKINIFLPVSYTLSDGALVVEADCSGIEGENHDKNVVVTHIGILPFFGADTEGKQGDYILLPDGCGATVELSEKPEKFEDVSLDVYEDNNLLGAFGMKSGDSAYVAFISEGAELSCVKAHKALSSSGHNRVYSSFEITPTLDSGDRVYVSSEAYKGKIRLAYRFLSYDNADYIGMAGAVRELLIRNGSLLSKTEKDESAYPFNLSVVFQNYVTDSKGRALTQTLTTYSQAQEMLDSLKAKGVENINLRLKGVLDEDNSFSTAPGKIKDVKNLISYGAADSVTFYTDASLVGAASAKSSAVGLDGEGVKPESKALLAADEISENATDILSFMRDSGAQGICINDAGRELYSDFSEGAVSLKNRTAEKISQQMGSFSASGKLMTDTGNIYAVKYADVIVNIPSSAKLQDRELCERVPFIQAVLHGIADYSCEAVNSFKNSEKAFLKAVEYGAVPYYEWYASDLSTQEMTDNSSYLNYIAQAQSQYERAAAVFEDLRDARITDHYKVKKNVYYTCYDNSTGIYVNYSDKAVTVSGVTVEAMSFLRVN